MIGRPVPHPVEASSHTSTMQLSPSFVEWMMGLPAGWVTDVPGLSKNGKLHALGNGVVPQAATHALTLLGVAA